MSDLESGGQGPDRDLRESDLKRSASSSLPQRQSRKRVRADELDSDELDAIIERFEAEASTRPAPPPNKAPSARGRPPKAKPQQPASTSTSSKAQRSTSPSTSSFSDVRDANSPFEDDPTILNPTHEVYSWSPSDGVLSFVKGQVSGSDDLEVLNFPPGSYYGSLPPTDQAFMRNQPCVCDFEVSRKWYSTIRDHFIGCKQRKAKFSETGQFDVVRRLYELQALQAAAEKPVPAISESSKVAASSSKVPWVAKPPPHPRTTRDEDSEDHLMEIDPSPSFFSNKTTTARPAGSSDHPSSTTSSSLLPPPQSHQSGIPPFVQRGHSNQSSSASHRGTPTPHSSISSTRIPSHPNSSAPPPDHTADIGDFDPIFFWMPDPRTIPPKNAPLPSTSASPQDDLKRLGCFCCSFCSVPVTPTYLIPTATLAYLPAVKDHIRNCSRIGVAMEGVLRLWTAGKDLGDGRRRRGPEDGGTAAGPAVPKTLSPPKPKLEKKPKPKPKPRVSGPPKVSSNIVPPASGSHSHPQQLSKLLADSTTTVSPRADSSAAKTLSPPKPVLASFKASPSTQPRATNSGPSKPNKPTASDIQKIVRDEPTRKLPPVPPKPSTKNTTDPPVPAPQRATNPPPPPNSDQDGTDEDSDEAMETADSDFEPKRKGKAAGRATRSGLLPAEGALKKRPYVRKNKLEAAIAMNEMDKEKEKQKLKPKENGAKEKENGTKEKEKEMDKSREQPVKRNPTKALLSNTVAEKRGPIDFTITIYGDSSLYPQVNYYLDPNSFPILLRPRFASHHTTSPSYQLTTSYRFVIPGDAVTKRAILIVGLESGRLTVPTESQVRLRDVDSMTLVIKDGELSWSWV